MLKIAHRGASGHAAENTLEAFEKAIQMGVDMIELDIRLTKDKVPVVVHDRKIHRITDGKGKVASMKFKNLRRYWQKNGEKITTIEEALAFINGRCDVNIELKNCFSKRVIDAIYSMGLQDKVVISSFFKGPLVKVRKMCPNIRIGVLRKYAFPYSTMLKWCKDLKAYSFHPYYSNKQLTRKTVRKFQKHGFKVFVWHVENPKLIEKFKAMKVDGIMSNMPERI